ncbi:hypothetical protein GRJ2_002040300 [Grus japonensis]|uniref:Uncharacterized protein n=1 Tax=Grus japonensis TaxID=30415 RepID=A0ABC9XF25_GRUJA
MDGSPGAGESWAQLRLCPEEVQSTSATALSEAQLFLNQTHLRTSFWMTNVYYNRLYRKLSLQLPIHSSW